MRREEASVKFEKAFGKILEMISRIPPDQPRFQKTAPAVVEHPFNIIKELLGRDATPPKCVKTQQVTLT